MVAKRRSVLNDAKYGPGNGPHWGADRSRYPNITRALADEPDPKKRRAISKSHRHNIDSAGGVPSQ